MLNGEAERVFGGDERDNSFTYNQSSHNTVTFSTVHTCNHNCNMDPDRRLAVRLVEQYLDDSLSDRTDLPR